MKCYHRTPFGRKIIADGFRDSEAQYMATETFRGVWLSNVPLDSNEGTKGEDLLTIEIPDAVLAEYEWIEEGKPYREFLVPAELVNKFGPPEWAEEDDE